ncbi:MAG TPA: hypothetical protein DD490_26010 [Acidobacteria bacterium]|nr:hypothetical protein [Acidobacteriota bacterium]
MALAALRGSAGVLAAALPAQAGGLAWREVGNRLEAFDLFRRAEAVAGLPAGAPLGERLARILARDPWSALFVAEGLGYAEGLRLGGSAGTLPAGALIPLHTGLGLHLAEAVLAEIAVSSPAAAGKALEHFVGRCRALSRAGCEEALLEQLGLAARALDARHLGALDRLCAAVDRSLCELFWHGVGRGLYFAPMNLLPWGEPGARALDEALEAPHALARANAVAGLGWALALVNFRHPSVLESFLLGQAHRLGDLEDALAQGIAMAALTWWQAAGREARPGELLAHAPAPRAARLWERCVRAAWKAGLAQLGQELAAGRCGGMFRYRPRAAEVA